MIYEESAPSPAFAPFVERYWAFSLEGADPDRIDHIIVPDGTTTLSLTQQSNGGWAMNLAGPSVVARRIVVERGARYCGVRFRAGAVPAFLGIKMAPMVEQRFPVNMVVPDLMAELHACPQVHGMSEFIEAFETGARARAARSVQLDTAVCALVQILADNDGSVPLGTVMADFEVGARQLRRRFVTQTGLTPKTYSRLRRVRRACVDLVELARGQVAAVSFDHGFADQPHFSREIRAVFDMSPQLIQAYLQQIRHHNVEARADDVRFVQAS